MQFTKELNNNKEQFINMLKEKDVDGDSFVSGIEFNHAINKIGYELSEYQVNYLLTALALNKDKIGIKEIIENIEKITGNDN